MKNCNASIGNRTHYLPACSEERSASTNCATAYTFKVRQIMSLVTVRLLRDGHCFLLFNRPTLEYATSELYKLQRKSDTKGGVICPIV
jgi:hypothetical protein